MKTAKLDSTFSLGINENGVLQLKKEHHYYCQIQAQMALCGAEWCDFVAYTFRGLYLERVTYNETFWLDRLAKLETFYFSNFVPCLLQLQPVS